MSSTYETVKVEHENGIAWVILNRPDKRNAMSSQLHYDMCEVLDELEHDPQAKVLVLTGAGDAWCAGQDLKLFFRDLDNKPVERTRAAAASHYWRWQKLFTYAKPTIAHPGRTTLYSPGLACPTYCSAIRANRRCKWKSTKVVMKRKC